MYNSFHNQYIDLSQSSNYSYRPSSLLACRRAAGTGSARTSPPKAGKNAQRLPQRFRRRSSSRPPASEVPRTPLYYVYRIKKRQNATAHIQSHGTKRMNIMLKIRQRIHFGGFAMPLLCRSFPESGQNARIHTNSSAGRHDGRHMLTGSRKIEKPGRTMVRPGFSIFRLPVSI